MSTSNDRGACAESADAPKSRRSATAARARAVRRDDMAKGGVGGGVD
jgi:hypothetical protein